MSPLTVTGPKKGISSETPPQKDTKDVSDATNLGCQVIPPSAPCSAATTLKMTHHSC